MSETPDIAAALRHPRQMEELYRSTVHAGGERAWAAEVARLHEESPDDPVLAAWYYRLQPAQAEEPLPSAPAVHSWRIHWQLAVPLGVLLGVIFYFLLADSMVSSGNSDAPRILYLWSPLAAVAIVALVAFGMAGGKLLRRALVVGVAVLAIGFYVTWLSDSALPDYQILGVLHLPLAALAAVGLIVAGWGSDNQNRFAFLIKSTEAVVTGGIIAGATGVFMSVTVGIFQAIGVRFPDELMRLGTGLAAGLIPLLAVATVYDARFAPIAQNFEGGMSRLIATMGRFFLPLTMLVGIAYVISIPFNFWKPFEERDVLIIYNGMLFAVMALLVFATPVAAEGVSGDVLVWLRRGIVAVAVLTVLVSVYALSATVYRASIGGLTINRLTIIGWNVINLAILVHLLSNQARGDGRRLARCPLAHLPSGHDRLCCMDPFPVAGDSLAVSGVASREQGVGSREQECGVGRWPAPHLYAWRALHLCYKTGRIDA